VASRPRPQVCLQTSQNSRGSAMKYGREAMVGGVVTFSKGIIEQKWKKNEEGSNSDTPPLPSIIA